MDNLLGGTLAIRHMISSKQSLVLDRDNKNINYIFFKQANSDSALQVFRLGIFDITTDQSS